MTIIVGSVVPPRGWWKREDKERVRKEAERDGGYHFSMNTTMLEGMEGVCFSIFRVTGNWSVHVRFWANGHVDFVESTISNERRTQGWLSPENPDEWRARLRLIKQP